MLGKGKFYCDKIVYLRLINRNRVEYIETFIIYAISNLGYGDEELPYNPRYDTLQHAKAGSALATIPEDGPPPAEASDPVAFPEGPHEDDPESVSSTKNVLRPSCGMYKCQIISLLNTYLYQ